MLLSPPFYSRSLSPFPSHDSSCLLLPERPSATMRAQISDSRGTVGPPHFPFLVPASADDPSPCLFRSVPFNERTLSSLTIITPKVYTGSLVPVLSFPYTVKPSRAKWQCPLFLVQNKLVNLFFSTTPQLRRSPCTAFLLRSYPFLPAPLFSGPVSHLYLGVLPGILPPPYLSRPDSLVARLTRAQRFLSLVFILVE